MMEKKELKGLNGSELYGLAIDIIQEQLASMNKKEMRKFIISRTNKRK